MSQSSRTTCKEMIIALCCLRAARSSRETLEKEQKTNDRTKES